MISLNQVKTGTKIIFRDQPHEVLSANHLMVGRGGAKLQTKLRNLIDHSVYDYTFSGDERLDEAAISFRQAQYLYSEEDRSFFMANDNFAQFEVSLDESKKKYLTEGLGVDLLLWQEKVVGVRLPKKMTVKVDSTEPGVKGDTVSAATKKAVIESGAVIQVPLFIKVGDQVVINTETGRYDSRV